MQQSKIEKLNAIYFGVGLEKNGRVKRNFLLDDFNVALTALIQLEIITQNIIECDKNQRPNRMQLEKLYSTFLLGVLIRLRLLFKTESTKNQNGKKAKDVAFFESKPGSRTGGAFIDDLVHLKESDIKVIAQIPGPLKAYRAIYAKANNFNSEKYLKKLLGDNEAVGLHKDKKPEKRDVVSRGPCKIGDLIMHHTETKELLRLNVSLAAEAMNAFADVVATYLNEVLTFCDGRNLPAYYQFGNAETLVRGTYSALGFNDENIVNKTITDIKNHYSESLKLAIR